MSWARAGMPALLITMVTFTACAEPEASAPEAQPGQGAACDEVQQQQLALVHQLVQTERQLQAIGEELRSAKDESFFAALERQQGVLRETHAGLITELEQLVHASSGETSPLPAECASVRACFAL